MASGDKKKATLASAKLELSKMLKGTPNSTGLNAIKKIKKQTPAIKKLRSSLEASVKKQREKIKKLQSTKK